MEERVARLYHQVDVSTAKRADKGNASFPQWPGGYVMVALMLLESDGAYAQLVEVIRRSQHSDRRWFHGPGLMPTPMARRSTMVGDIVLLPSGITYRLRGDRLERVRFQAAPVIPSAAVSYAAVS